MKNKIVELAREQIGNDYTTYCRDMGYNYRIEWCACFISWLAKKLNITDIIPVDIGCNSQIRKFKSLGVWHTDRNFSSGDIIYYDWDISEDADHVGIIEEINGNMLSVIEGNAGNYPDDRVRRRNINSESPLIFGYARPNYLNSDSDFEKVSVSLPILRKGSFGKSVKSLQLILDSKDYSIGKCGIDGDFGADTDSAVRKFQEDFGIEIDGIVGKDTWSNLIV